MGEMPSLSEKTVDGEVGDLSQVKKVPSLEDGDGDLGSGLFRLSALSGVSRCSGVARTPVSTCSRLRCGGAAFRTASDIALVLILKNCEDRELDDVTASSSSSTLVASSSVVVG